MPKPKKPRKTDVGTWYAIRIASGKWYAGFPRSYSHSFAEAMLFQHRGNAVLLREKRFRGATLVSVRCRPLSTRTKASKKRTR